MEADHLGGDTDMVGLIEILLDEQKRAGKRDRRTGASRSGRTTATR